jgi:hypothetical protein
VKSSKPFLFVIGLVLLVSAQNARPALADGSLASQSVSNVQRSVMAKTCYPVWGQCTKDSDCCTGYCRVGRVYAYCDYGAK